MEDLKNTMHKWLCLADEIYEESACNHVNAAMEKAIALVQNINEILPILVCNRIKISSYFIEDLQDVIRAIQENDIFLLMDRVKYAFPLEFEKMEKQIGETSK